MNKNIFKIQQKVSTRIAFLTILKYIVLNSDIHNDYAVFFLPPFIYR